MTTRAELRDLAATVLRAANTLAGANVRSVSVVPTSTTTYRAFPVLFVTAPMERKTSLGRAGAPKFTKLTSLSVTARVAAQALNSDETTASVDIDGLVEQVENAILGSYDLLLRVQQFAEIETHVALAAMGGTPIGEATIHFHCELFETYQPPLGEPLTLIDAKFQTPSGQVLAEADFILPQT